MRKRIQGELVRWTPNSNRQIPDAYDEKYAKWNMADLPIIPSDYKYEVAKSTEKQFAILKKTDE